MKLARETATTLSCMFLADVVNLEKKRKTGTSILRQEEKVGIEAFWKRRRRGRGMGGKRVGRRARKANVGENLKQARRHLAHDVALSSRLVFFFLFASPDHDNDDEDDDNCAHNDHHLKPNTVVFHKMRSFSPTLMFFHQYLRLRVAADFSNCEAPS